MTIGSLTPEPPVPVTDNNWSPIERFDHGELYAQGTFLLWFDVGEGVWHEAWTEEDRFMGEWRYMTLEGEPEETARINTMEPVAYKLVEGPNIDRLRFIVEHHGFGKAAVAKE